MGDGNTADRVVAAPAAKATLYGVDAAVNAAARALGDTVGAVTDVVAGVVSDPAPALRAAALLAPAPQHVVDARTIWASIASGNPALQRVLIADIDWYADYASQLPGKAAIAELPIFAAWTNSSTLIVVSDELFDAGDKVAAILLRHEAKHTDQFIKHGDRPPATYLEMVTFEAAAYAETLNDVKALAAGDPTMQPLVPAFEDLVNCMRRLAAKQPGGNTESEILAKLQGYSYQGVADPLLPLKSGATPAGLYVP